MPNSSRPYVKARLTPVTSMTELHQEKPERLLQMIRAVVEVEAPVHASEVTQRIMEAYGVGRAGARITSVVDEAIRLGVRQGVYRGRGSFVYCADSRPVPIRSRAHLDSVERKIEWVAPEELEQALLETVALGFSMSREDAISGALGLLGFGRATSKIVGILEERIGALAAQGRLQVVDGVMSAAADAAASA